LTVKNSSSKGLVVVGVMPSRISRSIATRGRGITMGVAIAILVMLGFYHSESMQEF
jgi:hypothetical protein